ncbi:MAG: hypothetical protein AB1810_00765 [Pseudomonadota bacterium]
MTMYAPLTENRDDLPYSDVHLMIYHNDTQVLSCRPLYIGLIGMKIASGPLTYPKHTPLEVRLSVPTPEGQKEIQVAAAVTASSEEGLGLTYDHRFGSQVRRLLELLTELYRRREPRETLPAAGRIRVFGRAPGRSGAGARI